MKYIRLFLFTVLFICLIPSRVSAESNQTEVSQYAFSWNGHTEIPYVYGGPGGRTIMSLEECSARNAGCDCSGFVSLVYRHFDIIITAQSEYIKREAVSTFTDESMAVPGDVVWWYGHVAIYIGDGKIIHTNTARGPYNYPHVDTVDYRGDGYVFCRMVSDIQDLRPLESASSSEVQEAVENTEAYGSIVTDSDITGMPIKSTLIQEQKMLEYKGRDNLTQAEIAQLEYISQALNDLDSKPITWYRVVQSFGGMCFIIYGILLALSYLFDYSNVFIDFSLLALLSFGKFRIVDDYDIRDGVIEAGYDKNRKVVYLTAKMLVVRVIVIIGVGLFLISGYLGNIILKLLTALSIL